MNGVIFLILRLLLAAILYFFLGWSLHLIWKDLRYQKEILTTRNLPEITIRIKEGQSDRTIKQKGAEILIGRDPSCECSLSSAKVSGIHASLSFHHNHWWFEDLNSTNGSFINDERVSLPTVVVDGDELQLGDALLTILVEDELFQT